MSPFIDSNWTMFVPGLLRLAAATLVMEIFGGKNDVSSVAISTLARTVCCPAVIAE